MKKLDFQLTGMVVQGQQLGRQIGFPTANLEIKKALPIKQGVYLVQAKVLGEPKIYWGMSDYWMNPKTGLTFETHFFDFDRDIYGQTIKIELVYYHRPNVPIHDLETLKNQLTQDKKDLKEIILKIQLGS